MPSNQTTREGSRVVATIPDRRDPSRTVATMTIGHDGCTIAIVETIDQDCAQVDLCVRGAYTLARGLECPEIARVDIAAGQSVVTIYRRWGRIFIAAHGDFPPPEVEITVGQAEQLGREIRRGLGFRSLKPSDPRELADLVADGDNRDPGFLDRFFGRLNRRVNVWNYITETVKGEWKHD